MLHFITTIADRFRLWQQLRANRRFQTLLSKNQAVLCRYDDDSAAWVELNGQRFYFDGPETTVLITTYLPVQHERRLIKTSYPTT